MNKYVVRLREYVEGKSGNPDEYDIVVLADSRCQAEHITEKDRRLKHLRQKRNFWIYHARVKEDVTNNKEYENKKNLEYLRHLVYIADGLYKELPLEGFV